MVGWGFILPVGKAHVLAYGHTGVGGGEKNDVYIFLNGYNIRNRRNGVLGSALHMMEQANMNLGVLFNMNLTGSVYTCHLSRYSVLAYRAPINHLRGLAIFLLNYHH